MPKGDDDILEFDGDLAPLFAYILENPTDIDDFPEDPWLGIVEFGSETWQSRGNVTFSAAHFSMDLDADGPSNDDGSGSGSGGTGNNDDDGNAAAMVKMCAMGLALPAAAMLNALWV